MCGGPFWCDFRFEFKPLDTDIIQVFGHTRGDGIRVLDNNYCIDTLENTEPQFLELEL